METEKAFPTRWVIDVCRTCGRLAQWPFCEHREKRPADGRPWCAPIAVTGHMSPQSRLTNPPGAGAISEKPVV